MFHFILHFKSILPSHVFIASFVSFIFLNIIENLYHYSVGRNSNQKLKLMLPTKEDWVRIIIIMFIFALLQAFMTCMLGC